MQIGPYRIDAELGRGGMAVVYRATGPHGERVALKLLHSQHALAGRPRERFVREVDALTRLEHPHVVRALAHGSHKGALWLALELVQGETLQERLRTGPLSVEEAIRLTHQLAGALSHAHANSVIHRDLKPDNVLLRGTDALLADFGLALDTDHEGSRLSLTGAFLGTPGYWAPEQAQGQKHAVDARTDVYGLGGVLYACLTGRAPHAATSIQAYLTSQVDLRPQPPRELNPQVPAWLERVCLECLEEDPTQRPQSAEAVAQALLARQAPGRGKRQPAELYAGLLLAFVAVAGLVAVVASRSPKEQAPTQLATNPVPVEDSPLAAIEAALEDDRDTEALALCEAALGDSPRQASLLELRARAQLQLGNLDAALDDCFRALALDPQCAKAYVTRAILRARQGRYPEALDDARRGLEFVPDDPRAMLTEANCLVPLLRSPEAIRAYDRFLAVRPTSLRGLLGRAVAHTFAGNPPLALRDLDRALELEPESLFCRDRRAWILTQMGRYDDALVDHAAAIRIDPNEPDARASYAETLNAVGRHAEAQESCRQGLAIDPEHPEAMLQLGASYLGLGDSRLALSTLDALLEIDSTDMYLVSTQLYRGRALASMGRFGEAIAVYNSALERFPTATSLLLHRAKVLNQIGKHRQALTDINLCLKHDPMSAEALDTRGIAFGSLGKPQQALADFNRALEIDPELHFARANRGALQLREGNPDAALVDFDELLEHDPRDLHVREQRALAHARLGHQARAIADYSTLLEEQPERAFLWRERGKAHSRLRQNELAISDLTRALELDDTLPLAYANRGVLFMEEGRFTAALADFERALSQPGLSADQRESLNQARTQAQQELSSE